MTNETHYAPTTRPWRSEGRSRAPGEELLCAVIAELLERDGTNRLDAETIDMLQNLPWDQIQAIHDGLLKRSAENR